MNTHEILQPLFEIVCKIHCYTSIKLNFECDILGNREDGSTIRLISWYVGNALNPDYGQNTDYLRSNDLDEDKLNDWVAELEHLYAEATGTENETDEELDKWDWQENDLMNERELT